MSGVELAGGFAVERREAVDHRYARLLGVSALKIAGLTLAGTIPFGAFMYKADIDHERAVIEGSHATLIENAPVPEPLGTDLLPDADNPLRPAGASDLPYINNVMRPRRLATFNNPGFGLLDTYRAGESLGALDSIGANVSIQYGNQGINIDDITDNVQRYEAAHDVTDTGLYADSMGTIVELKLAVELYRRDPAARIPFIIMDSPAVCADALTPKSRSDAYALLGAIHIPGAEYSRYLRQIAEDYVRKDEIIDLPSLLRVNGDAYKEAFDDTDAASNVLARDQAQMIFSSDVEADLRYLSDQPADRRPVIAFMGTKDPADDDVVNTPKSYLLIQKWTDEAGLTLLGPYGIDNFYHGAQWRSIPEYRKVLSRQVIPDITAELNNREG